MRKRSNQTSFGTQIVRAVEALENAATHHKVTERLRHLIVDEYQDVDDVQYELLRLLGARPLGARRPGPRMLGGDLGLHRTRHRSHHGREKRLVFLP